MNMDLYNNFLGQFITNYAHLLQVERQARSSGRDLSADEAWVAAESQRRLLSEARRLLLENLVVGFEGSNFVSENPFDPRAGIEISPDRIRAMAFDAHTLATIASGFPRDQEWWYDPNAQDGVTTHFPGRADNPGTV